MFLHRFSNFAILENFSKARKLKVRINNDWMYHCVYQNRGQGSITVGVMSLGRF